MPDELKILLNPEPRFRFSLRRLMVFSICTGAGMVYSPLVTLFILVVFVLPAIVLKSWIESTVVSLTLFFLIGLLMPVFSRSGPSRIRVAHKHVELIAIALERYYADFRAYPPEDPRSSDSSELLVKLLLEPVVANGREYGPYILMSPSQISDANGDGNPELFSSYGGKYFYGLKDDGSFVIVDPGKDRLLGGSFSKQHGFVSDSRDVNGDGVSDHSDNLYSTPVVPAGGGL
jgi:hypothetical protein